MKNDSTFMKNENLINFDIYQVFSFMILNITPLILVNLSLYIMKMNQFL